MKMKPFLWAAGPRLSCEREGEKVREIEGRIMILSVHSPGKE